MRVSLHRRILTILGCLMLLGSSAAGLATSAQPAGQDIWIWTYENDGSGAVYDACYVLVGYSQEGCDANGDGAVLFEDVAYGTYTVRQTADLGPGRSVADFTITVNGGVPDYAAFVVTQSAPATSEARDLYIATVADDASYYSACYVLVGYSREGCDENRDGYVLFEDIPYGIYTVRQTADIDPYTIADFPIKFNASTDNVFYAFLEREGQESAGMSDVHLITRDPDTGRLLTGACYELVGYSNVGCDENRDGQVTFEDVPIGPYTVHQVTAPRGYDFIDDYEIDVFWATGEDDFVGLVVQQAEEQTDGTTDHVSLVFMDVTTLRRVASEDTCVRLVGGSQNGCDDALVDGQIDFLAVPHGEYALQVRSLPEGYALMYPDDTVFVYEEDTVVNTVRYVWVTPVN